MPRLVVVPTPIGNLEDITLRALRELRGASLILAEDTRRTRVLLAHYDISARVLSYHQHNRRSRLPAVLDALRERDVALVCDAGTPVVSDPGSELIAAAAQHGYTVEVLPGPNAAVTAFVWAGFDTPGFLFGGFLPRTATQRKQRLRDMVGLPYALVLYEAPHRLLKTLGDLRLELGDRQAVLARELTKIHQEVLRGRLSDLEARFREEPPRGELTLVITGSVPGRQGEEGEARQDMERRRRAGQDRQTATEEVLRVYGLTRNQVYRLWLESADEDADPS